MSKLREQVLEFHRVMGVPVHSIPHVPSEERLRLRGALCTEEPLELLAALGADPGLVSCARAAVQEAVASIRREHCDILAVADAIGDSLLVFEGTNLEFGIQGGPVLDAIHEANMQKADGPVREDGKRLKPPGWTPPDIESVLWKQGYEP